MKNLMNNPAGNTGKAKNIANMVSDIYKHSGPSQRDNMIFAGAGLVGLLGYLFMLTKLKG